MIHKNKPILALTGSTGFVGKVLVPKLTNKFKLILINRRSKSGNAINWDLKRSPSSAVKTKLSRSQQAVHLAAYTLKNKEDDNIQTSQDFYNSNLIGTLNFLSGLNPSKLKHLIYISTLDVYGTLTKGTLSENSITEPTSYYGSSKLAGEGACRIFCEKNNISLAILRLGHVYGPGEEAYAKALPMMIKKAVKQEELLIFGSGSAKRNYIYIEDVCSLISLIAKKKSVGVFNLVGDESISILNLAKLINKLGRNTKTIKFLHPNFPQVDYRFDNSKIKTTFKHKMTNLKKGLQIEIDYFSRSKKI